MILCIGNVLNDDELQRAGEQLQKATLQPGAKTAGWAAVQVKNNLQVVAGDPAHAQLSALVMGALARNMVFQAAALPRHIGSLLFSRSDVGMGYGTHADNAIMGTPLMRTDLAFTLFLAAPDSYEGGSLVIDDAQGAQEFKLDAGSLVLYPATTLHQVETVRSGSRLVVAGWVQSLVRDPRVREMLFDLDQVRRHLFETEGKSATFDLLSKTNSNLLRMYAEI